VALPAAPRFYFGGNSLQLRELINVVESGVRWWQVHLTSDDKLTRQQAAESIEELSKILASLSKQLAQGNETVRITKRLPTLRQFPITCPACGYGNRQEAKFCQACGTSFGVVPPHQTPNKRPMPLRFTIGSRTDQGRVRRINQDGIYTGQIAINGGVPILFCVVADGMGGHKAGEDASRIAIEVARAHLQTALTQREPQTDEEWQQLLRTISDAANSAVYREARADHSRRGMGTTLTNAVLTNDRVHLSSVGDTRAYMINRNGVTADGATAAQLTSDHSLVARLVDIGQITAEQARTHPQRNMLYRSIGTDPTVEIDTRSEQLEPNDLLLLCSDGLFTHVTDDEITKIALTQPDPQRACEQLVDLANQRGGTDNISVIIVHVTR
jgi:protein phosphatase